MKQKKLNEVLDLHKKWVNAEDGGKKADLSCANLKGAGLREADLSCADLGYADLRIANLCGANLHHANLFGANLYGADLRNADLHDANLFDANLFGANLYGADLRNASLLDANLYNVNLRDANLCGADLRTANLYGAKLDGANLTDVKYNIKTSFLALQCPEEGAFIGFKNVDGVIVKLEIPADAMRSSATTRKCRCSKAKVLGFYDLNRNELYIDRVINLTYAKTIYNKGEMVYPDKWDENRWNECSHGIHFFMTFDEAKIYCLTTPKISFI